MDEAMQAIISGSEHVRALRGEIALLASRRRCGNIGRVLARVDQIQQLAVDIPRLCGIYFLAKKDWLVYVGQSVDIIARVWQHRREGKKDFDFVFWRPCAPEDLSRLERQYIDMFMPRYNRDSMTRRRCSGKQCGE